MNKRLLSLLSVTSLLSVALAAIVANASLTGRQASDSYDATARAATKQQVYPGRYIIQLADAPLAAYTGGLPGLAATSPSAGGKLDATSTSARAYRSYLAAKQSDLLTAMRVATGRKISAVNTFDAAFNGMVVDLSATEVAQVAGLSGVVSVEPDVLQLPDTDRGPNIIGAVQADQKPALFQATLNGANEQPAPVVTAGTGAAVTVYNADTKVLSWKVEISELSSPFTIAHIHIGPITGTGGVLIDIADSAVVTGTSPVFIGSKVLTDTVVAAINRTVDLQEAALYGNGLYFNVHTSTNPGGEVRGQITPNMGEGMIVGVIDSGINATSASFADVGTDGYDHTNPLGTGVYRGVCDPANDYARTAEQFPCNDKLIGAYTWEATNTSPNTGITPNQPSPNDDDGHGSHTASTAAGNVVSDVTISGLPVGQISGVAPHANVIAYDVCGFIQEDGTYSPSCPTSSSLSSINQSVLDGVDVLNYSISGDFDPWADSVDVAFFNALKAGVLSSAAAGNAGPDAATVAHNGPWQMNVGATTLDRIYLNGLDGITKTTTATGDLSDTLTLPNIDGVGGSGSSTALSIVYAANYTDTDGLENSLCYPFSDVSAAAIAGKMVLCNRGVIGRVDKAENVQAAGGLAFVLANTTDAQSLNGDIYPIPGVHISNANGTALKAWLAKGSGHTAQIRGGTKVNDPALVDFITGFSSRGPSAVGDLLAPDIAAPGNDIVASLNDIGVGSEYGLLSGTSMASPHNAGALALLRQMHPDWTLMELMSALMTTAADIGYNPFTMGAGRVNVSSAVMAGLVLNETDANMTAADPNTGGDPKTLNVASFADDACVSSCSWSRTVRNTLAVTTTWSAEAFSSTNLTVTIAPAVITLGPGANASFTVTADVTKRAFNAYAFSYIVLSENDTLAPDASFPLAVQSVAAILPDELDIEGAPNDTVTSPAITAIAISNLKVEIAGLVKADVDKAALAQDSDNSDIYDDLTDGIFIKSIAVPSDTLRFVTKVVTSTSNDLDMFVHFDANGDGKPTADEQICTAATGAVLEVCDFAPELDEDGTIIIVIENWEASDAVTDTLTLETAVVGPDNEGNLKVSGPTTVAAKAPFTILLSWDLSGKIGDVYYGVIGLDNGAPALAANNNLGFIPVRIELTSTELLLPMIRK